MKRTQVYIKLKAPTSDRSHWEDPSIEATTYDEIQHDDAFGDDFDDFEEGGENDDDFGDFDVGEDEDEHSTHHSKNFTPTTDAPLQSMYPQIPVPEFDHLHDKPDLIDSIQTYLDSIYDSTNSRSIDTDAAEPAELNPTFLTDRSKSLWEQLTAPPPLQPPNWIKSRIRRLFLVSLGVPVDLDEILPASKQKKLVLPSTEGVATKSLVDEKTAGQNTKGGAENGDPNLAKADASRRRGPPPPPTFDVNTARRSCLTTSAALANFADDELSSYVDQLLTLEQQAQNMRTYWLTQRDRALGDKEAFEEVIDNLVKHAKRIRK